MRLCYLMFGGVLFLALAAPLRAAQTPAGEPKPAPQAPAAGAPQSAPPVVGYGEVRASQTRAQLTDILRQHPPTLWQVLRLDPTLLTDDEYLAPYPALAAYLRTHPEIARNPQYFLGSASGEFPDVRPSAARALQNMFQALMVLLGFVTVAGFLAWVIKTAVDYRRWLRLSKVQTDAHLKLVDRLTSNEDLLAYIQTPAGQRFLEGGPVATEAPRAIAAPYGRILWSVQAGTVVMLLGGGLLLISRRLAADTELVDASPFIFMLGTIALTVGFGFLLSALVAYFVSRRLGLLDTSAISTHA